MASSNGLFRQIRNRYNFVTYDRRISLIRNTKRLSYTREIRFQRSPRADGIYLAAVSGSSSVATSPPPHFTNPLDRLIGRVLGPSCEFFTLIPIGLSILDGSGTRSVNRFGIRPRF